MPELSVEKFCFLLVTDAWQTRMAVLNSAAKETFLRWAKIQKFSSNCEYSHLGRPFRQVCKQQRDDILSLFQENKLIQLQSTQL